MRLLYPLAPGLVRRGAMARNHIPPLPEAPTSAKPGTEEKLAVLAERARRGESLFHPADYSGRDGKTVWDPTRQLPRYRPWTDEDVALLQRLQADGVPIRQIAGRLGRSIGAVYGQLCRLHRGRDVV